MKKKVLVVIPVVIILALGGFFAYNYEFHVLGGPVGNGTAYCTSYLKGNCFYDATFSPSTDSLTVYGFGQITGSTFYNVGFAYAPAVTPESGSGLHTGPIGATFQSSSSLSNNILKSGQTIKTLTFDSINASAPPDGSGEDGYIWIAYTTSTSGSACVGPISSLTNCLFFNDAYINFNT
jgi:hypothetical protein